MTRLANDPLGSPAQQLREMARLQAKRRVMPLGPDEAAVLDELIRRDQRRARYRPKRIKKLKAELAMLEAQEAETTQRALDAQRPLPLIWKVA